MKIKQSYKASRRGFLNQMTVMSGTAFTASVLPFSSSALASLNPLSSDGLYSIEYTYMDEAFGNYPHYSEAIGFGRGHHVIEKDAQAPLDGYSAL